MDVVFDIGGSSMRVAISTDGKNLNQTKVVPTPQKYHEGIAKLMEIAQELSGNSAIAKLSGGLPGLFNEEKTMLTKATHLPDWVDRPIKAELEKILNVPVRLENDSAVGALGEANFGSGVGYRRVIYIAIGTGFGGAWVIDGKIVSGKFGFEPGHQIIDFENYSELESLVSGKNLSGELGIELQNVSYENITRKIIKPLAIGLHNTFLHWPSDIIVLGGGVILNSHLKLEDVRIQLHKLLESYSAKPIITTNKLGDEAGLFGALAL